MYQIIHILTFFACVFREMYSTLSGKIAQFFRILEVLCYPLYIGVILRSLDALSLILVRQNTEDPTGDLRAVEKNEIDTYFESIDEIGVIKKSSIFLVDKCAKSEFN